MTEESSESLGTSIRILMRFDSSYEDLSTYGACDEPIDDDEHMLGGDIFFLDHNIRSRFVIWTERDEVVSERIGIDDSDLRNMCIGKSPALYESQEFAEILDEVAEDTDERYYFPLEVSGHTELHRMLRSYVARHGAINHAHQEVEQHDSVSLH